MLTFSLSPRPDSEPRVAMELRHILLTMLLNGYPKVLLQEAGNAVRLAFYLPNGETAVLPPPEADLLRLSLDSMADNGITLDVLTRFVMDDGSAVSESIDQRFHVRLGEKMLEFCTRRTGDTPCRRLELSTSDDLAVEGHVLLAAIGAETLDPECEYVIHPEFTKDGDFVTYVRKPRGRKWAQRLKGLFTRRRLV